MRNPIENPIGFAERLARASAARQEEAARNSVPLADISPTRGIEPLSKLTSQLAEEGVVVIKPDSSSLLGRVGTFLGELGRELGSDFRKTIEPLRPLIKPVALPATAVLALVFTISCGPTAGGSPLETPTSIPTVRPTETPTPTATAEAKKPTATPTPEKLDFTPYEVYRGNLAEGGGIMLLFLPDGSLLYVDFTKTGPTSVARMIKPELFSQRSPGSFEVSVPNFASITGRLEDEDHGKTFGKLEIEVPSPTSPVGEIFTTDFTAESRGKGKQNAIKEFGILYREAGGPTLTDSEAQRILGQMCSCQLP